MQKIRRFLTPGWVLTAVVAIAFSYVAFTVLAPWQLGKNTVTKARNEQIEHSFEVDPIDVGELMGKGKPLAEGTEWRRVTAQGTFLPDTQVLLRNRPVGGAPAVQVLAIFRTTAGDNFVVNRGFVRPSGTDIPDIAPAPTEQIEIAGYTRVNELKPVTEPITGDQPQVYGVHTEEVSSLVNQKVNPDWIQLSDGSAAALDSLPLPTLESGPYLSYGIQWIFFGIMAPFVVIWFVISEIKERRRDVAEQEEFAEELRAGGSTAGTTKNADGSAEPNAVTDTDTANPATARAAEPEESKADSAEAQRAAEAKAAAAAEAELRRERLAHRYGDSGHRGRKIKRDNRYDERF